MSYTPTVWVDGVDLNTPTNPGDPEINATNLNKIEQALVDATPGYALDADGTAADGGAGSPTENAAIINASLAALSGGTVAQLSGGHAMGYGIEHPIIVPNRITLQGQSSHGAGTQISVQSTFPHTTVSGGQTLPSDTTTTFTLTVASTAGFPMATGGISLTHGTGVLCVSGCTIFYTGVTSNTFTGCRTNDVDVVLSDGAPVSTFAIWLLEPGATDADGAGTAVQNLKLSCGNVPGVSGIHSSHVQEQGGVFRVHIDSFANFGIRFESNPAMTGNDQPVNWEINNVDVIFSTTTSPATIADPAGVGLDLMNRHYSVEEGLSAAGTNDSIRGVHNFSCEGGRTGAVVKAGMRLNNVTGTYTDLHFEAVPTGLLVGDTLRTQAVVAENIGVAGDGFSVAAVSIGNIDGNEVTIRNVFKCDPNVPNRVTIKDNINAIDWKQFTIAAYHMFSDGTYSVNHGARVGDSTLRPTAAQIYTGAMWWATDTSRFSVCDGTSWYVFDPAAPISLVADSVATGARDNSSSSSLTVTFAKTTTVGNLLLLAACSSNNMTVSSVSDSRGNTWQVDEVSPGSGGVTANVASCHVGTAHQIGDTLTLTLSGAGLYGAGIVSEWSAIKTSSWLDQVKNNTGASGAPVSGSIPTMTQADELVFGAVGYNSASDYTAGTGYTLLTQHNSGAGDRKICPTYKVVQAIATQNVGWAGSLSNYEVAAATYKAAKGNV